MSRLENSVVIAGIGGKFPESDNVLQLQEKLFAKEDFITNNLRWTPGSNITGARPLLRGTDRRHQNLAVDEQRYICRHLEAYITACQAKSGNTKLVLATLPHRHYLESLAALSPSPPVTARPTPTPLPLPVRVPSPTTLPAVPAAALESAATQQHIIIYAEAVSGSPVPTNESCPQSTEEIDGWSKATTASSK
ncbi:hypothetical protein J6590_079794 [Homalodisca vitripennis]|nr:hypothetical protein J6590_079794 [Homalodisca vitripennis]